MRHEDVGTLFNHIPYNWEYANSAARMAATGWVVGDVYKLALQLDNFSTWVLPSLTGGWIPIGTAGNISDAMPQNVAAIGSSGSSLLLSRSDHIHAGVYSLSATGATPLLGSILLQGVSGTLLSQVGNTILIQQAYQQDNRIVTFAKEGSIAVQTGTMRWYSKYGIASGTILSVFAAINSPPTGSAILIDVNKNGSTIFATQGNRPTIAQNANTSTGGNPDDTVIAEGDYLTWDIDQVGSSVAGVDLTVEVIVRM